MELPRARDLAPCGGLGAVLGVLVLERDLGTSLLFSDRAGAALAATSGSWLLIGLFFAGGASVAYQCSANVQRRGRSGSTRSPTSTAPVSRSQASSGWARWDRRHRARRRPPDLVPYARATSCSRRGEELGLIGCPRYCDYLVLCTAARSALACVTASASGWPPAVVRAGDAAFVSSRRLEIDPAAGLTLPSCLRRLVAGGQYALIALLLRVSHAPGTAARRPARRGPRRGGRHRVVASAVNTPVRKIAIAVM